MLIPVDKLKNLEYKGFQFISRQYNYPDMEQFLLHIFNKKIVKKVMKKSLKLFPDSPFLFEEEMCGRVTEKTLLGEILICVISSGDPDFELQFFFKIN